MSAPTDKITEYLAHVRELEEKATKVVAWYPHSQYDGYHPGKASVRGPFGRWLLVQGGDNGMNGKPPTPVADLYDDAKYAAMAMNSVPTLREALEVAVSEISQQDCYCRGDPKRCERCIGLTRIREIIEKQGEISV